MTYRVRNVVLAVAVASLAAIMVLFYVANYKRSVQQGEENVTVYVAKHEIEPGTAGSEVAATGVEAQKVVRRSVVPGAVSDPKQIESLVATEQIYPGEQVTLARFAPAIEGGVRSDLKGNLRAFELAGSPNQVLAGTLKEGDRVDVVANFTVQREGEATEHSYTRTVLRDLLVLRASGSAGPGPAVTDPTGAGTSLQLQVTDAQAQKLFFTMKNASWYLDLRAVTDAADSPETIDSMESVLCDGVSRKNRVCTGR